MTELSRNAQVLRFLLEAAPGVGHTKLAKFAYLADLEARKHLGRAISKFRYVLAKNGPFDARGFFGARDELVSQGYATETEVPCGPYRGYELRPTPKAPEYSFSVPEAAVLRYVAVTYLAMSARDLCEDVVYETEPVKRKGLKVGEKLPMDEVNREEKEELGFDLERMLAGEQSAEEGRVRSLAEALGELRARHR
ncbi:MAG: hypothetical protein ACREN5_02110 [Gemmatimonadales bacterium]